MTRTRALAVVVFAVALAFFGARALHGPSEKDLLGLWIAGQPNKIDDELRFYYFRSGGRGLYRYGKVGFNQTRSFDWSIADNVLTLVFRKVGQTAKTKMRIETRDGQRELVLVKDPKQYGTQRYRFRPSSVGGAETAVGPLTLDLVDDRAPGIDRMWTDHARFATGGQGFSMYQLSTHGIGIDKLGWFHTGDFDDWSTETLAYRAENSSLALKFLLRGESASTSMFIDAGRTMVLTTDPRDFGATHRYIDGGPSL